MVLPLISCPLYFSLSQIPFLIDAFADNILFVKESNIPKACSPTASLFPSGALIIEMFLEIAYLTLMFSVPEPTLAIKSRFFALSIKFLSILNLLLITNPL